MYMAHALRLQPPGIDSIGIQLACVAKVRFSEEVVIFCLRVRSLLCLFVKGAYGCILVIVITTGSIIMVTTGSVIVTPGSYSHIMVTTGSVKVTPDSIIMVTPGSIIIVTPSSVIVTTGSVIVTTGSVIVTPGSVIVTPGSYSHCYW
ncbi:hypothetical protein Tco_0869900 [Tanacetum coccineum]